MTALCPWCVLYNLISWPANPYRIIWIYPPWQQPQTRCKHVIWRLINFFDWILPGSIHFLPLSMPIVSWFSTSIVPKKTQHWSECPVLLTQSHFLLIWFGFPILKVSLQRYMIATKVANWTCWPGFWHSPIYHACILAVLGGCFKISEINPVDFGFPMVVSMGETHGPKGR